MTADNFILQSVANDDPRGSITIVGSGSPRKAGSACEPKGGLIEVTNYTLMMDFSLTRLFNEILIRTQTELYLIQCITYL